MDDITKTVLKNTANEIKKYTSKISGAFNKSGSSHRGRTAGIITVAAVMLAVLSGACFLELNNSRTAAIPAQAASAGEVGSMLVEAVAAAAGGFEESGIVSATVTGTAETTVTTAATTTAKKNNTVDDGKHVNHEDVLDANYKSKYYIIVYTQNNTVRVLGKDENGGYTVPVVNFLCSTAKSGKVTPAGVYSINKRYSWRLMFGDVYAQYAVRFYGNYLFHSVPYLKESPDTLEMEEYEKLGRPGSLGCVRLCVRDAKWIYDCCDNGTQVRVVAGKDGPSHGMTLGAPKLNYDEPYYGWDPSDPNPKNPYMHPELYTTEKKTTTTTTAETTTSTEKTTTTEPTTESTTAETTTTTETAGTTTTAAPPDDESGTE